MPTVPGYPVIHVTIATDGSAHVNVAGRHVDFDAAPSDATRQAVTTYAASVAAELRRPVRTQITDPDGRWLVAVHPDGTVTELADTVAPTRRPRKQTVTVPAAQPSPAPKPAQISAPPATAPSPPPFRPPARIALPIAPPPDPEPSRAIHLDPEPEQTQLARRAAKKCRTPAQPAARLSFSTGDVAHIVSAALIGRRPSPDPGEDVELTVNVDDESRKLSRTHLRVEWHDGKLWATDRASSNGTLVERAGEPAAELTPWQPFELHQGDVAVLGDVRLTVSLLADDREVNL